MYFLVRVIFLWLSIKVVASDEMLTCGEAPGRECVNYEGLQEGITRISGGVGVESHVRPFQVALYTYMEDSVGFCGGVLISPSYVLTAAHCCYHNNILVERILVILGAHSLYDRYENGRRSINALEIIVHPEWDPESLSNDIALLHMETAVQITDAIEPAVLPYLNISSFSFAGMAGTVSGWGIGAEGVTFVSPTLREKIMTVMTNDLCNSFYFNTLPSDVICGFYPTAGTCKGDNGGPLTIFYSATNTTILVGIASFVQESGCNTNLPSVFTRVQNYLTWISQVSDVELL